MPWTSIKWHHCIGQQHIISRQLSNSCWSGEILWPLFFVTLFFVTFKFVVTYIFVWHFYFMKCVYKKYFSSKPTVQSYVYFCSCILSMVLWIYASEFIYWDKWSILQIKYMQFCIVETAQNIDIVNWKNNTGITLTQCNYSESSHPLC